MNARYDATLADWCHMAYMVSKSKGWHDDPNEGKRVPERIALMHSELSELLEAFRKDPFAPCDKPIALSRAAEEVADIFIRLADFCKEMNIDLEAAVICKHEYNKTRPAMHGGKAF